jgi:lambda repressor-like predicted transcriptional regulator
MIGSGSFTNATLLPPILEIYVVWHPLDRTGRDLAQAMVNHFQGSTFAGLVGGAVEVYVRSAGWQSAQDAPRPIPFPTAGPAARQRPPHAVLTAVVPVLDVELAAAVQPGAGPWHDYLTGIVRAHQDDPARVAVFPIVTSPAAAEETELGRILQDFHAIGRGHLVTAQETAEERYRVWSRDLAQGITQYLGGAPDDRLTVFISHSTKVDPRGNGGDGGITARVRAIVANTPLAKFFSTTDLQPGRNWSRELTERARSSALLAIRTSTYASRPWCQREMLIAKTAGMPIVVLDALDQHEERGSFLMDHVPRVRVRRDAQGWHDADIVAGLNLLVDECLKRTLWQRQGDLAGVDALAPATWWAPHAPEPVTLVAWLHAQLDAAALPPDGPIRIIHPDPPIGPDEYSVLDQIVRLGGLPNQLDVVTPRLLATRAA